jgi:hypothetical protein
MNPANNLELIFPQDLKMWAKAAKRKFLKAQDRIKALSASGIPANAYWDEKNNVVIISEDSIINETYE